MNTNQFIQYSQNPNTISKAEMQNLQAVIENFPFFQSARALYLKGLFMEDSYRYNFELKKTAAITTERGVLFDFITSKIFVKNTIETLKNINDIEVIDYEIIRILPVEEVKMIQENIKEVLDNNKNISENISENIIVDSDTENFENESLGNENEKIIQNSIFEISNETFSNKINTETIPEIAIEDKIAPFTFNFQPIVEKLEIGKPIPFDENEKYSFFEWLKISQIKPINRNENQKIEKKNTIDAEKIDSKTKKSAIIDQFLATNPKILPAKNSEITQPKIIESVEKSHLMTETLAKVYLEQKKYDKAIQAFQILILKNPEKSVFFANRIKDIKILQQNNI